MHALHTCMTWQVAAKLVWDCNINANKEYDEQNYENFVIRYHHFL